MNVTADNVQNLLFMPQDEQYSSDVYPFLLRCAMAGTKVVVLTHNQNEPNFFPLLETMQLDFYTVARKWPRLMFMMFTNISDLIGKLLELHVWTIKPHVIVVDLCPFIELQLDGSPNGTSHESLVCFISRCISALLSYMNYRGNFEKEAKQKVKFHLLTGKQMLLTSSIVIIGKYTEQLTCFQLEMLKSLYYYKNNAFDDFEQVKVRILDDDEV